MYSYYIVETQKSIFIYLIKSINTVHSNTFHILKYKKNLNKFVYLRQKLMLREHIL